MAAPSPYSNGSIDGRIKIHDPKKNPPRMRWTAENDNKLLVLGLGKEIAPAEYKTIAGMFAENPTPKAIQERLAKLRKLQSEQIEKLGIGKKMHDIREMEDALAASLATMTSDDCHDVLEFMLEEEEKGRTVSMLDGVEEVRSRKAVAPAAVGAEVEDAAAPTDDGPSPPPRKVRKVSAASSAATPGAGKGKGRKVPGRVVGGVDEEDGEIDE